MNVRFQKTPEGEMAILPRKDYEALIAKAAEADEDRGTARLVARARKDIAADFPLRGFVLCGDCGRPMTACWSVGRWKNRFAYYLCAHKGCVSYRKSVRRQVLESEFGELLKRLTPSQSLFRAARAMFEELWHHRLGTTAATLQAYEAQVVDIERKVEQLVDRITQADVPSIVKAYENRIRTLETCKAELKEKAAACGRPAKPLGEQLRTALEFLASPRDLWTFGSLEKNGAEIGRCRTSFVCPK